MTGVQTCALPIYIDTVVDIAAPIEVVWHALADLASYGEWNPYVVRADGEATVGAVVQITAHPTGDAETTYPITVLEVEPPSDGAARMVWEGGHADAVQFRTEHIWELTTTDDGTHVHHHEYFRGALAPSILAERGDAIRTDFICFNEALRARAESSATTY